MEILLIGGNRINLLFREMAQFKKKSLFKVIINIILQIVSKEKILQAD